MTKEQLQELGLSDDQVKKIQELNGKDIEKFKQSSEAVKTELETLKTQLSERSKELDALKPLASDTEQLKTKISELEAKHKEDGEKYKAELAERDYSTALNELFSTGKFASELAKTGAITEFRKLELPLKEGKIYGGAEWLEKLVKEQPAAFVSDAPKPEFASKTQGSGTLGKEPLTYSQMMERLKTNPNAQF